MIPPPQISIIIPAFDAERHIVQALESVRAQNIPSHEVIVIDDGSKHSPDGLVRSVFPHARLLQQSNLGPAAARNLGLRIARGNFIAFLDADDLWTEGAVARMLRGFDEAPSAELVQGSIRRWRENAGNPAEVSTPAPAYFSFNVGALMVRRAVFERTGLFDEGLRQSEDVDFHIRMREANVRKLVIPDTVLLYRQHATSSTTLARPSILTKGHGQNWLRLLHASLARRRNAGSGAAMSTAGAKGDITVVMVVRNGRKYLPAALSCVRRQTVRPAEILAVVAASEDGSEDYLRAQPDVRFVVQTGTGLAAARNQGIEAARCDLIAFLDCGDLWHPEKLASQIAALSLLKGPGFSITSFVRVSGQGDDGATTKRVGGDGVRIGFTPSALVVHRDAVRTIGGFDASLGIGCDSDWFFRARQQRLPCAVASQVLLYKRIHDSNLSRFPAANRENMFKIIAKGRGLGVSRDTADQVD